MIWKTFFIIATFSTPFYLSAQRATENTAKGTTYSDLNISCRGVNEANENLDFAVSLAVEGPVDRLTKTKYIAKANTSLFEISNRLSSEGGLRKSDYFFRERGERLYLDLVFYDSTNFSYSLDLPAKAIRASTNEYPAVFLRSHSNAALSKKVQLLCKTDVKEEAFEFPYISPAVFDSLTQKHKEYYLSYALDSVTYVLRDDSLDAQILSAQDQERFYRWSRSSSIIDNTEMDVPNLEQSLSESDLRNLIKMRQESQEVYKEARENLELIFNENDIAAADELGFGVHVTLKVLLTKQNEVIGYVIEEINDNLTDDGDDDQGTDYFYDHSLNLVNKEEWGS